MGVKVGDLSKLPMFYMGGYGQTSCRSSRIVSVVKNKLQINQKASEFINHRSVPKASNTLFRKSYRPAQMLPKKKVLGLRNGGGKLIFHHLVGGVFFFFSFFLILVKLHSLNDEFRK